MSRETKTLITLEKDRAESSLWMPLEKGTIRVVDKEIKSLAITDSERRPYVDKEIPPSGKVNFQARGTAGVHMIILFDEDDEIIDAIEFRMQPETRVEASKGPYAKLAKLLENLMVPVTRKRPFVVDGKLYNFLVSWGRDHTHVMKAMKYYIDDVKSGVEFFLERQQPNGMFWDDCHRNHNRPWPSWFNEALGDGFWDYSDDMEYTFRRIPVEADVEFLITECVWYVWKATGDDGWMAAQLPRLEKALKYNGSHPDRWSKKHQLVRRSFCADSWDFANPHYCNGDHRCINPGDPQFLFHSDNSGFYASHWRMAEMYEAIGDDKRADELRKEGEKLRERANEKLFFDTNYGHMIPEKLPEEEVYATVGDERKRMSLSTGYTINRGLPTHEMAVKILKEYQRRLKANIKESFAEWWSMDPMYEFDQWPGKQGSSMKKGHYMNGAVGLIVAGELAKAAFDHGMEDYGVDILNRVWQLVERDNGVLHSAYMRLPEVPPPPNANFEYVDLRDFVNVGLKHDARKKVPAWTGEGDNDMRNLPIGKRKFGVIGFDVIDPKKNDDKAVLRLDRNPELGPETVIVPVNGLKGESIYFMQALAHNTALGNVVGEYDVCYTDGTEERIYMRNGHELSLWWGITDNPETRRHRHPVNRDIARVAWQGPNAEWKNVGLFMTGWNNPHPDKAISAIRLSLAKGPGGKAGIMLAAISVSDEEIKFETPIRSGGWPESWSQAAVYYSIAEGLAGIEDKGAAFSEVSIAPRWAYTDSPKNQVVLHYPASGGYCAYDYKIDKGKKRISLDVTGSFKKAKVHCLLPKGDKAKAVRVNRVEAPFENTSIEKSNYVDFVLDSLPEGSVIIEY
ncbi:MAG: hypothetical protein ACLFUS_12835 [Candidatus Sumerlaeia bacterium]